MGWVGPDSGRGIRETSFRSTFPGDTVGHSQGDTKPFSRTTGLTVMGRELGPEKSGEDHRKDRLLGRLGLGQ